MGIIAIERGEWEEELRNFRVGLRLNEKNPKAHWMFGLGLLRSGQSEEGVREIDLAIELGYDWYTMFDINVLTNIYRSLKLNEKLIAMYEDLIQRYPAVAQFRMTLARAYATSGETAKADEQARIASRLRPH